MQVSPNSVQRPLAPRKAQGAQPALQADLKVALQDADGFVSRSGQDLSGTISGTVRLTPEFLAKQLGAALKGGKATIQSGRYEASKQAIVIRGEAEAGLFFKPDFAITLRPTADGRLAVEGHSWLDWVAKLFGRPTTQDTLKQALAGFKGQLTVVEEQGKLIIAPAADLSVPVERQGAAIAVSGLGRSKVRLEDGRLAVSLEHGEVKGGSAQGVATRAGGQADRADLRIELAVDGDEVVTGKVSGDSRLNFDSAQLNGLSSALQGKVAPDELTGHATVGDLVIEGRFANAKDWNLRGTGRLAVTTTKGMTIDGTLRLAADTARTDVQAEQVRLAYPGLQAATVPSVKVRKSASGTEVQVEQGTLKGEAAHAASQNRLGLLVDGHAFARTLEDAIARAEDHIHAETFEFDPSDETRRLLTQLAERAAGIRVVDGVAVPTAPIPVRILSDKAPSHPHSWPTTVVEALNGHGDEAFGRQLREAILGGKGPYASLTPAQRETALQAIATHLEVRDNPYGLLRTDHRKVWVFDGAFGITGGMNLGGGPLSTTHDVMVPTIGPAVRDMQAEWLDNWSALGTMAEVSEAASAEAEARFAHHVGAESSEAQVLVTDAGRNEIQEALVKAIDGATSQIRLEHQYLTEDRVLASLQAALKRGVDLQIVIPDQQGDPFTGSNRAEVMRLLDASREAGAGRLDVHFFRTGGKYTFHNHTKALSVDGRELLVGSANLDARGLSGSLVGQGQQIAYNEELDLRVADAAYVARFDEALFAEDVKAGNSKSLGAMVVETRVHAALQNHETLYQAIHRDGPDALTAIGRDFQSRTEAFLASALPRAQATPEARAKAEAAVAAQGQALAALPAEAERLSAALEAACRQGDRAAVQALVHAATSPIYAALPAGQARELAEDEVRYPLAELLATPDRMPAGQVSAWHVRRVVASVAIAALHAAALPAQEAIAPLIEARPAAFDAEIRQTLVPDAAAAEHHERVDFLY